MDSVCSWRFVAFAFLTLFAHLQSLTYAEKAPKYSFIQEATSAPKVSFHDYIIIGGGTAGCPLAATLATEDVNVLVLERGGSPYANTTKIRLENFVSTLADNSPDSFSQAFISEDGVFQNRARGLGGGTIINAGFYSHAEPFFLEETGLDEELAKASYAWVEKMVHEPAASQWQSAVRTGLLEVGVLPDNGFTYAHINGTKTGGTIFDRNGNRRTAADLLEYANPKRIKVYLHAIVHKITFMIKDGPRPKAEGVIFYDANGGKHTAYLKNKSSSGSEILLSAGAIGSPQLLMLSGIGPATRLQSLGVNVVFDQPMVGRDMGDHPLNGLTIPYPNPIPPSVVIVVGITRDGNYVQSLSGFDFSPRSNSNGDEPRSSNANLGSIFAKFNVLTSKGYLELKNTNVSDNPKVRFNYFQTTGDLKQCARAMQTVINVVDSESVSRLRFSNTTTRDLLRRMTERPVNLRPQHPNATTSLEQYCIDTVATYWHYHGGCRVGKVVDRDYKVLGVDSLRVIDASTFSFSPGTNPMASIMMFGRSMGQRILQSRRRR